MILLLVSYTLKRGLLKSLEQLHSPTKKKKGVANIILMLAGLLSIQWQFMPPTIDLSLMHNRLIHFLPTLALYSN